jgi:hypothetical protein
MLTYERIPNLPDPSEIPNRAIAEAIATLRATGEDRDRTGRELNALSKALPEAERRETEALANSIRTGKAAPATSEVEQIKKAIDSATRRLAALELVLLGQIDDVRAAVESHREEAIHAFEPEVEEARKRYTAAITVMTDARSDLTTVQRRQGWLANYSQQPEFKAGTGGGFVSKLHSPAGDPYTFQVVVDALQADANPARPKPAIAPLVRRVPVGADGYSG